MSHIIRMKTKIDPSRLDLITESVSAIGGQVLGRSSQGLRIKLQGWRIPVVLSDNGEILLNDDLRNKEDIVALEAFKDQYMLRVAQEGAQQLGWYSELQNNQLVIYHPDGGTLTVGAGQEIDANGFTGVSCDEASQLLERFIGERESQVCKEEFFQERAIIKAIE